MTAASGDTVLVHYRGTLDDGTEFDSSAGREPLEFVIGAGTVISGFESAVTGLAPGEKRSVRIEPHDAYGPHDPELVHRVEPDVFAEEPYVGAGIELVAPDGTSLPGRIAAVEGDEVVIDFNHPLAGQALSFEIELVDVAPGAGA